MDEIEELEQKVYYIYGHKNKLNGKWYIGQTCQKPERRWRDDGKGYIQYGKSVGCKKFSNAIKKYGWNNFEHIILEITNEDNVDNVEMLYIKKYNSVENGYNLTYGGGVNHKISEETRMKLSNMKKGELNHFYGKHHTEETKRKLSIAQKQRNHSCST